MDNKQGIGFLLDLDGVIYNDSQLISGAPETIQWLRDQHIPFRFITNTTMRSRHGLRKKLEKFGIPVAEEEIFSAVYAAVRYIRQSGKKSCHLLLCEDAQVEFSAFELKSKNPDFVVVGDLGDNISFEQLNIAFQRLYGGAELLGLQKNRYWISDRGITLDAGAFVALLEFAAQKEAIIVGKPELEFFTLALQDIGLSGENVYMVGDDLESDIIGAANAGINGILVRSGKYNDSIPLPEDLEVVQILDSINDLPDILLNL